MPITRNTLMRIKTIDECLCRRQRKWTLEDLQSACEEALFEYEGIIGISTRTIQRDIELMRSDKLGYNAPIVVVDRKYYAYEDPNYSITKLPLSENDIAELNTAVDIIKHYQVFQGMSGSEDILTRIQDRVRRQTDDRQIVYIETNELLKGTNYLSPLYNYISKKEAVVIKYHPFKSNRAVEIFVSPYMLKEFNNRWFLIGYNNKRRLVTTLALDRIEGVRSDGEKCYRENTFFDPDAYLGEMIGVTRNLEDKPEFVVIKVDADQAPYVLTKPFHPTQQIVQSHDNGDVTVMINVIINRELKRMLLGFGEHIEVVSPKSLRQDVASTLITAAEKYR